MKAGEQGDGELGEGEEREDKEELTRTTRTTRTTFPIPDSRFPIPNSRFPIPDSQFPILNSQIKMTPTLLGRWQTRLFLLATVGALITLPFHLGIIGPGVPPDDPPDYFSPFFPILGYVALFGMLWDVLYIYIQQFRWDRDWPGAFQLLAGIWEAVFVICIVKFFGLPSVRQDIPIEWFTIHYSLVWLGVYLASQSIMRILFPRWRFHGGRLL